jgi:hypothetical protein
MLEERIGIKKFVYFKEINRLLIWKSEFFF